MFKFFRVRIHVEEKEVRICSSPTACADTTFNLGYGVHLNCSRPQQYSVGEVGPLVFDHCHSRGTLFFHHFHPPVFIDAVLDQTAVDDFSRRPQKFDQKRVGDVSDSQSNKLSSSQRPHVIPLSTPLLHYMQDNHALWNRLADSTMDFEPGHIIVVCGVTELSNEEYNTLIGEPTANGTANSSSRVASAFEALPEYKKALQALTCRFKDRLNQDASCQDDDRANLVDGEHNDDKKFVTASRVTHAGPKGETLHLVVERDPAREQELESWLDEMKAHFPTSADPGAVVQTFIHYYKLNTVPHWHKYSPYHRIHDYLNRPIDPLADVRPSYNLFDPVDVLLDFIKEKAFFTLSLCRFSAAIASDLHLYALFRDHGISRIPLRDRHELGNVIRKLNPEIFWVDKNRRIIGLEYALAEL